MDTEEEKMERKKAIQIQLEKWVKKHDAKVKTKLIQKIPWHNNKDIPTAIPGTPNDSEKD